jgi:hypothetical protein
VDVGDEIPPEADPKFFFTVHSAWCQHKRSDNLTVELKRPELSGPEWQDLEGKGADKGLVGEALKLSVSCNEDMEEGAGVTFKVYKEGADPKLDRAEAELAAVNKGGKAEAEWPYRYRHDPENPLTEKPKFFFIATGQRCKEVKSGNVEIGQNYHVFMENNGEILANVNCKVSLSDGTTENTTTDGEGFFELNEKTPGSVVIIEYTNSHGEDRVVTPKEQKQPEY